MALTSPAGPSSGTASNRRMPRLERASRLCARAGLVAGSVTSTGSLRLAMREQLGVFENLPLGPEGESAPALPPHHRHQSERAARCGGADQEQVRERLACLARDIGLFAPRALFSTLASEVDHAGAQGTPRHWERRSRERRPSHRLRTGLQHCGYRLTHLAGLLLVPGPSEEVLTAKVGP